MGQKNQKKFLVLEIIAIVSGMSNSYHPEKDLCHWQSMCYETPPRFNLSLREIFSKSSSLRVMGKYDESHLMPI